MSKRIIFTIMLYVAANIILVVPFVPLANVLPAGFGALSMNSMAISLILAARWRVIDRLMGGPDKSYASHRWLGFFSLLGALLHWLLASPVGAGVFPILSESGEHLGNVAAMALLIMTLAAMVKKIPYHLWKASHMLMGPTFLIAVYHTFFVASPLATGAPPWMMMSVISALGIIAWIRTIQRHSSPSRLVRVERVKPFEGGVDVILTAKAPLPAFKVGQFATIARNHARSEPHPFTIAGGNACSRRFVIRSAGDWTECFVNTIKSGDELRLGRVSGRFLPQINHNRNQQLWVAGGVGITPFLAALEKMEPDNNARIILIYCIRSRASSGVLFDIERHAERLSQLELIVISDTPQDALTAEFLSATMNTLDKNAQLYLCGPDGLKARVISSWKSVGKSGRVHSEKFDFRGAVALTSLLYIGKPVLDKAWKKASS